MASLKLLTKTTIWSSHSAALVILGLSLILRNYKHIIEYEKDKALHKTPFYMASSIMDLQCITKVNKVVSHTASKVVGLVEVAMRTISLH
jgi:hypothetical protein